MPPIAAISDLRPTAKPRQENLVEQTGIDVSDWGNMRGGASRAACNPRYCYEWVFIKPKEFVVLNLWHRFFEERSNVEIFISFNSRKDAGQVSGVQRVRTLR